MKICDVCRAANEPEAEFCGTCGSRLPAAAPVASTGTEPAADPTPKPDTASTADDAIPAPGDEAVVPGAGKAAKASPGAETSPEVVPGARKGQKKPDDRPAAKPEPKPDAASDKTAPWNTGKAAATVAMVTCPVCQTENEADREFCRKCASALNPTAVVKPKLVNRSFLIRFFLSFVIGVVVPIGGAAAVGAVMTPKELPATPVALTLQGGEPLDFEITETEEGEAQPIEELPATTTVQLAEYKEAVDSTPQGQNIDAKWWSDGVPRVPAISQFDGGPLQKVNCAMAAGAMLARLAYGIVTTGSQLRSLQADQEGGTNFGNVNDALDKGWGVTFLRGSLTALQMRALSYAGAGITVSLAYGEIPVGVRLQESFTGGHAVYIDAFTPNGPDGVPAYWVMDPIGHSWAGYKGKWWPAADVERAALARNGGWISAAWAFAGGRIPEPRPVLPKDAYPGAQPGETPGPTIGPPIEDPMPTGDTPIIGDPPTGTPPPVTPVFDPVDFDQSVFEIDPDRSFAKCAVVPAPSFCPAGIIGIVDLGGVAIATKPPLRDDIKLLYADALAPGTYQIIFETPPDTDGSLFLWTGTKGELREANVQEGVIDGKTVQIATVNLDPNVGFSFFTTATGDGYRAVSDVGSLKIGQ